MRFGQVEVRALAALLVQRFRLDVPAGHELRIRQMPTIGPRGGLPVDVTRRVAARSTARAAA
jgi:cytochrome P450